MNFLLHCDHVWLFVKSPMNVTCLEFLQFFQVSLAASTNWHLKLNFYLISENKYNKFDSFFKKTKKNPGGRERSLKMRGFRLKQEGWDLCITEAHCHGL